MRERTREQWKSFLGVVFWVWVAFTAVFLVVDWVYRKR